MLKPHLPARVKMPHLRRRISGLLRSPSFYFHLLRTRSQGTPLRWRFYRITELR
jgi:hypothetical protein